MVLIHKVQKTKQLQRQTRTENKTNCLTKKAYEKKPGYPLCNRIYLQWKYHVAVYRYVVSPIILLYGVDFTTLVRCLHGATLLTV